MCGAMQLGSLLLPCEKHRLRILCIHTQVLSLTFYSLALIPRSRSMHALSPVDVLLQLWELHCYHNQLNLLSRCKKSMFKNGA